MQITEVQINKLMSEEGDDLKGYASVTFDGTFAVHGIRIVEDKSGALFISFPARRRKNGGYNDIAHPTNNVLRQRISEAVLEKYREFTESVAYATKK